MKNIIYINCFVVLIIVSGCSNDNKLKLQSSGIVNSDTKKIYDQIMATHDEVMPKMSEVNDNKQKLRDLNELITEKNIPLKDTVLNTIMVLSKLEDDMSDWMTNFRTPENFNDSDSTKVYLTGQQKILSELNDNVKKSLQISDVLIKKIPR